MNFPQKGKNRQLAGNAAFLLVLFFGLFLRGYQYFMNRSLWHDEAHLAMSFIVHGYIGLLKPLMNWQAAPIFFLFSVETFAKIFGVSELSLRATPFIISILTLPLIYFLCYELTKNRITSLIAFFLFAINITLVYYSSELKPYIIDTCAFIVIPWLIVSSHAIIVKYRTKLLTSGCCLAILFTNTAPVILMCAGLFYFSRLSSSKRVVARLPARSYIPFGIVLFIFIANYFFFIYDHPYAKVMKEEWASTFWPINIFSDGFRTFIDLRTADTFYFLLNYSKELMFPYIFLGIFILGATRIIIKKNKMVFLFVLLPILIQVLLSVLQLYPFYARFAINLVPAAIILFSIGLQSVASFISNKTHYLAGVAVVSVCLFFMAKDSIKAFPRWDIDIKPSLQYINEHYPGVPIVITTPLTMYEYYYKTGFVVNGNYERIGWSHTPESYFEEEAIKSMKSNYILLHSTIGGDNTSPIVEELYKRGLIVKDYKNNNFAVTEVKPVE